MTAVTLQSGGVQRVVDLITPDAQDSTNDLVVLTGSGVDVRVWSVLSYTISIATNGVKWAVYGANAADYSDEVVVKTLVNVAAAAIDSYTVTNPPYGFYRVKIQSNVADVHGTATLRGMAK